MDSFEAKQPDADRSPAKISIRDRDGWAERDNMRAPTGLKREKDVITMSSGVKPLHITTSRLQVQPVRRWRMRRVVACFCSLWCGLFLAGVAGCAGQRSSPKDNTASDFVLTLHGAIAAGDWKFLYDHIDFDAKGIRMLGDVYRTGTPEAKQAFRATMERQFRETTTRYWPTDVVPRLLWAKLSEKANEDGTVEVLFGVPAMLPKFPESLEFAYIVRATSTGFVLEDRELRQGGKGGTLAGFVQYALGKLRSKLGREPSLADWNENFTQLMSGTRVRQIEVPRADGTVRGFQHQ